MSYARTRTRTLSNDKVCLPGRHFILGTTAKSLNEIFVFYFKEYLLFISAEDIPKVKHPPISIPRENILKDKIKQYPFFSQEWTQKLKKELDDVSSELKPLIEIAKLETETLQFVCHPFRRVVCFPS